MAASLLLCSLLALNGSAAVLSRPVIVSPGAILAPAAPVAAGMTGTISASLPPALAPSLIAIPAPAAPVTPAPTPVAAAAAAPAVAPSAEEPLKAGGPRWQQLLKTAQALTAAETARILALRGAVKIRAELATNDTKTITEYTGAPSRVEKLETAGRVYRHWILDRKAFEAILEQGALRAGPVSYVEFTGGRHAYIKDIYVDIHGSFFTTTERSAAEPRVMNQEAPFFVDFRLPDGVSALRLDGDDVMVIPASPGTYLPIEIVGSSPR